MIVLSLLLTGCGDSDKSAEPEETPTTSDSSEPTETTEPTGPPDGKPITQQVLDGGGESGGKQTIYVRVTNPSETYAQGAVLWLTPTNSEATDDSERIDPRTVLLLPGQERVIPLTAPPGEVTVETDLYVGPFEEAEFESDLNDTEVRGPNVNAAWDSRVDGLDSYGSGLDQRVQTPLEKAGQGFVFYNLPVPGYRDNSSNKPWISGNVVCYDGGGAVVGYTSDDAPVRDGVIKGSEGTWVEQPITLTGKASECTFQVRDYSPEDADDTWVLDTVNYGTPPE